MLKKYPPKNQHLETSIRNNITQDYLSLDLRDTLIKAREGEGNNLRNGKQQVLLELQRI